MLTTACIDEDAFVLQGQSGSEDRQLTSRNFRIVSGTGLSLKIWQSHCHFLRLCSFVPCGMSNSSFKAILKSLRAAFHSQQPFSNLYNLHKWSNSNVGEFEGWNLNFGYFEKKPSSGVLARRGGTLLFLWPGLDLLVRGCSCKKFRSKNKTVRLSKHLRVNRVNLKERTSGLITGSPYRYDRPSRCVHNVHSY